MRKLQLSGFLVLICSSTLIASITTVKVDTSRNGVFLTFDGFRSVLFQRDSLQYLKELNENRQQQIALLNFSLELKQSSLDASKLIIENKEKSIKDLKKTIFKRNAEIWVYRGLILLTLFKIST